MKAIVVGTGFGCRVQIPALRGAGFEVVGLVGTDAERTRQRAADNDVPQSFTDLDAAIAATGAAAVTIATPPETHAPLTLAALARGCHVICEKPFAMNSEEAKEMRDAAAKAGVVNLIGHEFRFYPEWAILAQAIAAGMIGELRFVSSIGSMGHVATSAQDMPEWWFDKGAGGGWLGAYGSHLFDAVLGCFGEVESLSAALPNVSGSSDLAEDSFALRFRLENGAQGIVQQLAGSMGPPLAITRAEGNKGTLWVEGNTVWLADKSGTRELPPVAGFTMPERPPITRDPRNDTPRWRGLVAMELAPYTALCLAFRALIEGREPSTPMPLSTFADGVNCMAILDAIRASAARGGEKVRV